MTAQPVPKKNWFRRHKIVSVLVLIVVVAVALSHGGSIAPPAGSVMGGVHNYLEQFQVHQSTPSPTR